MSGVRKKLLPLNQWWWTPFFDETIQDVLETRLETGDWCFCETQKHALAWPLVAYEAIREFSHSARPYKHEEFLQFYALDPEFASALLFALTLYAKQPHREWSFDRALLEIDDVKWDPRPGKCIPAKSWQDVVNELEPNDKSMNRPKTLANRENKERARRLKILHRWEQHFRAKESLPEKIAIANYPFDVAPTQNFPMAYLPPQRLLKRGR